MRLSYPQRPIVLSSLSLALAMVLSACGGSSNTEPTLAAPTPAPNATTTSTTPAPSSNTGAAPSTTNTPTPSTTPTPPANTGTAPTLISISEPYMLPIDHLGNDNSDIIEDLNEMGIKATQAKNFTLSINSQPITQDFYDLRTLGEGFTTTPVKISATVTIDGEDHPYSESGRWLAYQRPNSIVLGSALDSYKVSGKVNQEFVGGEMGSVITGNFTKVLPTSGTYQYQGVAFDKNAQGTLSYSINFDEKTGQGEVSLGGASIGLAKAPIHDQAKDASGTVFMIEGEVPSKNAQYTLGIFGENAQEIAGYIEDDAATVGIGFSGIKK